MMDEVTSDRKNPKLKLFEMSSPKRQALIDTTEMKETVRNKFNELKSLRKELKDIKMSRYNMTDEKKVEKSEIRKMNEATIKVE